MEDATDRPSYEPELAEPPTAGNDHCSSSTTVSDSGILCETCEPVLV